MSYVEKVLQPGEGVGYQASVHWVTYLHGLVWLLAAGIVWFALPTEWRDGLAVRAIVTIIAAIGLYFLAQAWFNQWITEIAVTNRRVIYKHGFISRTTAEMNMDKIESVKVDQSILGRMLDYGKVTILGTGASAEALGQIDAPIASPIELRNHITGV